MKYYSKMLDGMQFVYRWLMIVSMFVFTAVIIASVFFRYVLGNSLMWSEQLSRFLFVWVIMVGVPVIYRGRIATDLDLVTATFPEPIRHSVAILMDILVAAFGCYYGYAGLRLTMKAGATIFEGLYIPAGFIYAAECVCGISIVLCAIESIYKRSLDLKACLKARKENES